MARVVNVSEIDAHNVAMVFNAIKSAAMLIEAIDPDAILESWAKQEATMPFADPTAFQEVLAQSADIRRKKAIIEAAARFLREWNQIKTEALAAAEPDECPGCGGSHA